MKYTRKQRGREHVTHTLSNQTTVHIQKKKNTQKHMWQTLNTT